MFCSSIGQRQQPVEEGRDRRQLLAQRPVAIGQLEPGRRLELLQRAALDLAGEEHGIELAQRSAGIGALQIVLGPEQALAAGLALALGDGAQRVEPARDGGQKALLGLHVGGDRPEQRRLRLIGAVACGPGPGWRRRPSSPAPADSARAGAGFWHARSAW